MRPRHSNVFGRLEHSSTIKVACCMTWRVPRLVTQEQNKHQPASRVSSPGQSSHQMVTRRTIKRFAVLFWCGGSADVSNALLGGRLSGNLWLGRQLKNCTLLTFA